MRRPKRATVESLAVNSLDVTELHLIGALKRPCSLPMAAFRWPRVRKMRVNRYRVEIEFNKQSVAQIIPISWTPCHFGGERPWFHCPFCQRRVARLLKGLGGYFCRPCVGNPVYESQRRSKKARHWLQAYRIRVKLDGSHPLRDEIPVRPRGMRRNTYARLQARLINLEQSIKGSRLRVPSWVPPLHY